MSDVIWLILNIFRHSLDNLFPILKRAVSNVIEEGSDVDSQAAAKKRPAENQYGSFSSVQRRRLDNTTDISDGLDSER
ncbi:MAG: hypothetical protein M1833_002157 [Piccolia ochrophora]|nr:MAG: hypothetical protein M1833_002157 [Piccolia ochrophora]